jgi:putative transcriptional regulator
MDTLFHIAVAPMSQKVRSALRAFQADLADRLQISRQSINAIETGKFDPSLPLAFRIARLFGQPIETIFDAPE